jgi:WS/DGAT/MGAT family acyltransferase
VTVASRVEGLHRDRLSDADAILWSLNRDPLLRSAITMVVVLDREPVFEDVVDRLGALCRRTHHFRSIVEPSRMPWERPRWKEDEHFDVAAHVAHVRAAEPRDLRTVLDLAQGMAMNAFDPARPLWEAVAVDDMVDGRAALIVKVHHAVIDGVGGLEVAASMLDRDRGGNPLLSVPEPIEGHGRSGWDAAFSAIGGVIRTPGRLTSATWRAAMHPNDSARRWLDTLTDAGQLVAPTPHPLSSVFGGRSLGRQFEVVHLTADALDRVDALVGVTVNDVFVAGLLRGLSLYHGRHGAPVEHLRAIMPVSTRRPTDPLESNRFVPVRLVLPVNLPDAESYLRVVPDALGKWKHSPALGVSDLLTVALDRLPSPVTVGVFAMMLKGVDFVATDVPGPPTDAFLAGGQVEAIYAFAPLSGAAINVALVTMAGRPCIGVNIDCGAVSDPSVLTACLSRGINEVAEAAPSTSTRKEEGE